MEEQSETTKKFIPKPQPDTIEVSLEFLNNRLEKTEQALFQFKLDIEKDPSSKLPSDLLSMVDEICGQLPRLPTNTARKIAVRLQPMLQTLDQIIKKLEASNSDPIKSDKQFVNKAVKRYRQVQTTRKLL